MAVGCPSESPWLRGLRATGNAGARPTSGYWTVSRATGKRLSLVIRCAGPRAVPIWFLHDSSNGSIWGDLSMNKRYMSRGALPRRTALTVAMAMGLGFTGLAFGQATTGSIFGTAPAGAGDTVMVQGANGTTREVAVDADGRYSVTVPVGRYTVTLRKDGQVLATQENVGVSPGGGTNVPFTAASAE